VANGGGRLPVGYDGRGTLQAYDVDHSRDRRTNAATHGRETITKETLDGLSASNSIPPHRIQTDILATGQQDPALFTYMPPICQRNHGWVRYGTSDAPRTGSST